MTKLGRNDQFLCGSGKKYKRCCLPKDEAAAAAAALAKLPPPVTSSFGRGDTGWEDDGLADASNRAVDLIHEGKLDEAELAARDLLTRYPDVHDGFERLGAVYEARGERKVSAEWYRKALAFMQSTPTGTTPNHSTGCAGRSRSSSAILDGRAARPSLSMNWPLR